MMTGTDFAAVDPCPCCHVPVRHFAHVGSGAWYCRPCIRAQMDFGRDSLTPYMVDVPVGDRL